MERLLSSIVYHGRDIDVVVTHVHLSYGLSPGGLSSALFNQYGDMRKGTESTLVQNFPYQFAPTPLSPAVDKELVDDNEDLYHAVYILVLSSLSVNGRMVCRQCHRRLRRPHDTYLIFDRYINQSTKGHERQRRSRAPTPGEQPLSHIKYLTYGKLKEQAGTHQMSVQPPARHSQS